MLEKVSDRITALLVSQGVILEEDSDIYSYGLALIISFLFNTVVMLIVGALVNRFIETLLFLAVFVLLRSFTGGYHADTFLKCMLITFSTYALVIALSSIDVIIPIYLSCLAIGFVIVLFTAPVEHPNKEISERKKVHHKITSAVMYIIFSVIGILVNNCNTRFKSVIFFALLADIVLLFIKESTKGEMRND